MAGDRLLQRGPGTYAVTSHGGLGVRIGVEDLRGVQPVHPPGRRYLLPEADAEIRVIAELGPDDLEGDRAAARGEGEVHPAHAARA